MTKPREHSNMEYILKFFFVCVFINAIQAIRHSRNLIWAQTPTLKIGVSRIVGIEGDPAEWVPNGNVQVRHISAPHVGWQFKALSYNYVTQTLYWTESTNKKVQGLRLNGTTETETIFMGTSTMAEGLAVDWISNNIYWTDSLYKWIIMAPLGNDNNVYRLVVRTGMSNPHSVVVYPQKGYLFWTDMGMNARIECSDLLGGNRRVVVDNDIQNPRGITIDFDDQLLYWVDSAKDTIESVEFNGNNRRVVAFTTGTLFSGISVFQNYLFVTEQLQGHLRVYEKYTGSNEINYQLGYIPDGIAMYDGSLQQGNSSACDSMECDQICVSDPQIGPFCQCGEGYNLQDDAKTCLLSQKFGAPSHIYAIRDAICQYPINLPDMAMHNVSLESQCFLRQQRGYHGLAYDARNNMLYYTESETKSIGRIKLEIGASGEAIIKGVGEVQGLAFDWSSGNLLWTDMTYGHIMMSRKSGLHPIILVEGLDKPVGIAVYPERGEMYWTETGDVPMIYAASMDGSNRRPLVNSSNLGTPNHLYLDYENNRLYWADSGLFSVRCVNLDSLEVDIIYGDVKQMVTFFGISMYKGYILWTDKDAKKNGIHVARIDRQEKVRGLLHAGLASDLITFDIENQPPQTSPCAEETNLCEQICIPTSNTTYICACGLGYTLDINLRNCYSKLETNNFLLAVDSYQKQIYQLALPSGDVNAVPLTQPYKGVAIDYNPITNRIYWTDNRLSVIMTASLAGGKEEVLFKLNNDSISDGIAVDHVNQLLFYTCTGNDVIGVVSLVEPSIYKTLINTSLDQPRDIVVHPELGKIYWSDWGVEPKIEAATMDGANRTVLMRFQNESWPNAISLDTKSNNLFWLDARTEVVGQLNLDTLVTTVIYKDDRAHYFGMTMMGGYLYMTDWLQKHIWRVSVEGGSPPEIVGPALFSRLNGIVAYNRSEIKTVFSKCMVSSCSHFCLPVSSKEYKCACSDEGKYAKIPCRELNEIDVSVVAQNRQRNEAEDGSPVVAIGLSVMVVVIVLIAVVGAVYIYNKRCRGGPIAHGRLVEDTSHVDTFYRISFSDGEKEEPNFDSGIENPSFTCSSEDIGGSQNLVRYPPM